MEVLYLENLVAEVFDQVPRRPRRVHRPVHRRGRHPRPAHAAHRPREAGLHRGQPEFVKKTMAGMTKSEIEMPPRRPRPSTPWSTPESESDPIIDPMPNLYFTRDPFAVVGEGVNLNRMYSVTRNRETLYGKYVFKVPPLTTRTSRCTSAATASSTPRAATC